MKKIKRRITAILMFLVMTALVCLVPAIRSDADAERYTIVFSCATETEVLTGVRLNTDEASISYTQLVNLVKRADPASIADDDSISQIGNLDASLLRDDALQKLKVISAFDGVISFSVYFLRMDTVKIINVTCTEYQPGPEPPHSPESSDPKEPEVIPHPHYHVYIWKTITPATSQTDGKEVYVCESCGLVAAERALSALWVQDAEITNSIRNAPAGGRLAFRMDNCNTFGRSIRDAMVARPDVTVSASFLSEGHKGIPLKVTFPAGCDISSLYDDNDYLGLCRAGSILGYDTQN